MRVDAQVQIALLVFACFGLAVAAHVSESNQSECGPPLFGCSRSDLKVTQPDAKPVPDFGGPRGEGPVFRDPLYNDVEIVRCTNAFSNPAQPNGNYSVGLGGAGDKNSWNTDNTLLQITGSSGVPLIFHFDPNAKRCRPVCADGSDDAHCAGSGLYVTKPGVFSRVDAYRYYAFPSSAAPGTKVLAVTLHPGKPPSIAGVSADFAPALYKGTNPDWRTNAKVELCDVIQPTHNNDAGFELFQAVTAGVSGKEEPSWTNAVEPYRSRNHTPLPLPEWPGAKQTVAPETKIQPALTRNRGKFVFKATVGGNTGEGAPEWCQSPGCRVNDGSVVWMNMSASSTITDGTVTWAKVGRTGKETWISVAGVEDSDHVFGMGISYSYPASAQDTGVWVVAYNNTENKIYQLNTYTKIETDFVCTSGTGYDCKGGAWKRLPSKLISSSDNITVHATSMALDGKSIDVVCGAYAGPCNSGINKLWHFGTGTWDEVAKNGDGHSVLGHSHFVNEGAGAGADAPTQKYLTIRSQHNAGSVWPLWKVSPCSDVSQVRAPFTHPPCYPQFEQHLSWTYNRGHDEEPIIGATYINGNRYPAVSAWQYEIIGISACGREGEAPCPNGYPRDKIWRFGRTFNFNYKPGGTSFNALASIGTLAQSGRYYALTSMGLGTMGATNGAKECHHGFSWAKSFEYQNGAQTTPHTHNPRNLTFVAHCERECISGQTEPEWAQDEKTAVRDHDIVWVPAGVANCRSDVLIYKLQ
jgi:hypothetical protein